MITTCAIAIAATQLSGFHYLLPLWNRGIMNIRIWYWQVTSIGPTASMGPTATTAFGSILHQQGSGGPGPPPPIMIPQTKDSIQ